jgi:hypothetical protein
VNTIAKGIKVYRFFDERMEQEHGVLAGLARSNVNTMNSERSNDESLPLAVYRDFSLMFAEEGYQFIIVSIAPSRTLRATMAIHVPKG